MDARALARFGAKYVVTEAGCWEWTAGRFSTGYGQFAIRGRTTGAHIFAYEHAVGPVPAGLELDHLCRNRACVNPAHLEAVTHAENIRRGDLAARRVTHCPSGHPYDEGNTYVTPSGQRQCRECRRRHARAAEAKRSAICACGNAMHRGSATCWECRVREKRGFTGRPRHSVTP